METPIVVVSDSLQLGGERVHEFQQHLLSGGGCEGPLGELDGIEISHPPIAVRSRVGVSFDTEDETDGLGRVVLLTGHSIRPRLNIRTCHPRGRRPKRQSVHISILEARVGYFSRACLKEKDDLTIPPNHFNARILKTSVRSTLTGNALKEATNSGSNASSSIMIPSSSQKK